MRFGYLYDGPLYDPHYIDTYFGIAEAVSRLESQVPVGVFHRAGHPNANFSVELWEDKGVARKDMSFDDLKDVYRLYPTRAGYLVCNELAERLWNELQQPGVTADFRGTSCLIYEWHGFQRGTSQKEVEVWLGHHHSRGIDYLRYGELGASLGEQRLAEIGRKLLENAEMLASQKELSEYNIYNAAGLSREECINATLVRSDELYFTVRDYGTPLLDPSAEWYPTIDEALDAVKSRMDQKDLAIVMNDELTIGAAVGGQWVSSIILSPNLPEAAQDALSAFQAASYFGKHTDYYDRLYFTVGNGQTPPTNIYEEFKQEAKDQGIYDLDTALTAFSKFHSSEGKTLYASFGRDIAGQCNLQHIPIMAQDQKGYYHYYSAVHRGHDVFMGPIVKACLPKLYPANEMVVGKWGVKLVPPGEKYGLGNSMLNDSGNTLVEFYDRSQDPNKFPGGQFVSRYYADTLLGRDKWGRGDCRNGLSLYDDIPEWTVTGEEMRPILAWLQVREDQLQSERKPSLGDQMKSAEQRRQNTATAKDKEARHERA